MSSYNTEHLYNANGNEGGIFYNMNTYIMLISLREVINASEDISKLLANYVLRDRAVKVYDTVLQAALYKTYERMPVTDNARYSALYEVTDYLEISSVISK